MKSRTIHINIDLWHQLNNIAKEYNMPIALVAEQIISEWLQILAKEREKEQAEDGRVKLGSEEEE